MKTYRGHLFVSGRVQGVGFRYGALRQGIRLGLNGWVRNLGDGRVELVFEGPADAVNDMVEWCQRGPPGALVDDVEVRWEAPTGELEGFDIRS